MSKLVTMTFHIRAATPNDIDTIIHLIKDLATYEREPDSARATPELLQKNLFDTPYAHALLAVSGSLAQPGEPVALALYFFNFSTWTGKPGLFLEDLYVTERCRNQGIGKAMFGELAHIAQQKNCARLDWAVLKWNAPSIAFYEEVLGAKGMSEWQGMRLEGEGISALSKFRMTAS
ncbi:acyl-CoA N-acyltransferase [Gautieria morchelliformis]|nr:acyl-CoA N-acyltransferase [Gautieria morchelliformis]